MSTAPLVRVVAGDRSGNGLSHRMRRVAFGLPTGSDSITRLGRTDTIYHFAPGSVFSIVWWHRDRRGNQRWVLAILEAPRKAGEGQRLPGVRPLAIVHAMLKQNGPAGGAGDVDRVLDLIRCMREHDIEPAKVSPRYWRDAAQQVLFAAAVPELPRLDTLDTEERTCDA